MNLPFAFEEPFFEREVHAYDLRLAKALIKNMTVSKEDQEEIDRRKDFKPGNPSFDLAEKEGRVVYGGLGTFEIPKNYRNADDK